MNTLEPLTTTLERRRAEAREITVRLDELAGVIAAYKVVLADLQGLPLDAPESAAETAREPDPAPEPEVEPEPVSEPASEVDRLVAQIDLTTPYREMTTDERDAWYAAYHDQIRRLFEITTAGAISQALGIPSGSTTAAKKKVGAVVYDPNTPLERRAVTDTEDQPTPSENGSPPAETGGCAHQWDIATPNGPTSEGVCSVCGETKDFKNSQPPSGWDRTPKAESA